LYLDAVERSSLDMRNFGVRSLLLIAAIVVCVGCRGSSDEGPSASTTESPSTEAEGDEAGDDSEAQAAPTPPAAAGPITPQTDMIGRWALDVGRTLESMSEADRTQAAPLMSLMSLSMDVQADRALVMTMSMFGESETSRGRYEIVGSEGQTVTLMATIEGDDPDDAMETQEMVISFDDRDNITVIAGGDSLYMTRVPQ